MSKKEAVHEHICTSHYRAGQAEIRISQRKLKGKEKWLLPIRATVSMPIMTPLGLFAGVPNYLIVTAYQSPRASRKGSMARDRSTNSQMASAGGRGRYVGS